MGQAVDVRDVRGGWGPRVLGALARVRAARLTTRRWFLAHWFPLVGAGLLVGATGYVIAQRWYDWYEKRVVVVEPGQLVRGAFQRPEPLRRLIGREHIKTIVTLADVRIIPDRALAQASVVKEKGVGWIVIPIVGSRPSLTQMSEAADVLADKSLRPIFFHCVAGHHRTSLALAAYRIRHEGWSAERAWAEISSLPWASAETDAFDRRQVEAFAAATPPRVAQNGRR